MSGGPEVSSRYYVERLRRGVPQRSSLTVAKFTFTATILGQRGLESLAMLICKLRKQYLHRCSKLHRKDKSRMVVSGFEKSNIWAGRQI